jgi:hypothetical protein
VTIPSLGSDTPWGELEGGWSAHVTVPSLGSDTPWGELISSPPGLVSVWLEKLDHVENSQLNSNSAPCGLVSSGWFLFASFLGCDFWGAIFGVRFLGCGFWGAVFGVRFLGCGFWGAVFGVRF